jgi:hypothetical protein
MTATPECCTRSNMSPASINIDCASFWALTDTADDGRT